MEHTPQMTPLRKEDGAMFRQTQTAGTWMSSPIGIDPFPNGEFDGEISHLDSTPCNQLDQAFAPCILVMQQQSPSVLLPRHPRLVNAPLLLPRYRDPWWAMPALYSRIGFESCILADLSDHGQVTLAVLAIDDVPKTIGLGVETPLSIGMYQVF